MTRFATPVVTAGITAAAIAGSAVGALTTATVARASQSAKLGTALSYGFSGNAYSSRLHAADQIGSGRSAHTTLCTASTGVSHRDTTESSKKSRVGHVGNATTTASSHKGSTPFTQSQSVISGFNLLSGAITASAVTATANASHGGGTGTTVFDNLRINGKRQDNAPKPNKIYHLPGLGTLTLNEQSTPSSVPGATSMAVNGLRLVLRKNNTAKLPASTLTLAHATATTAPIPFVPITGRAFGSAVESGDTAQSGESFSQPLPCEGTDGHTRSNTGAGASIPGALTTGDVVSTAHSSGAASDARGTTSSSIKNVKLLGGVVTAKAIYATASVRDNAGSVTSSAEGSHFADLRVNGRKVTISKPNTKISLGSLGTLWLRRVRRSASGITVNMLDLHLNKASNGEPADSDLVVSNATARVRH